mmetsp:Transcript_13921/g.30748  ORF Transcript_13921/g.30748 Transcript_13921/m.30748 type:complete len:321 (-) Transcript_13921:26-988(-)
MFSDCQRTESESEDVSSSTSDLEAPAIAGLVQPQPEQLAHIKNRRGETLALYTWAPRGQERGVAVLFHGYATNSRFPTVVWLADVLIRIGLRCYCADMIGHGESEGTPGLLPGGEMLAEDGLDVVEHVRSKHPDKAIFLCGTSMGGAIAVNVGLLARKPIAGAVLLSPMVKQNRANLPSPTVIRVLRVLSSLLPSLAVISSNASQPELQYTDPVRREQCEKAPQYQGKMRLRTAATLLGIAEHIEGRLEDVNFPFFCCVGGKEVVVAADGPKLLFDRASTPREKKEFKLYPPAQHALLAELSPLREEIEGDIGKWVAAAL